ncbi:MAG: DUF721 domain-containing protein [Rhodobacteraceae bacterium]|nr:DUF721 domain-containing protein [Paracoccaceae bacterium]
MAYQPKTNSSKYARKRRGFVHAGGLLGTRIRDTTGQRGFAEARLLTQWPEIVGESVAKIAKPVKISYTRQGLGAKLTILALGANGPELQMQLPRIKERVNACYGYNAISEIRITQTASTGFGEGATAFDYDIPVPKKMLSQDQSAELKSCLETVGDSTLRELLEKLGRNVLLNS